MVSEPIRREEFEQVTGAVLDALGSQAEHDAALDRHVAALEG